MLELYTHPLSPCAQKVRIVLAEKGLDFLSHHVDLPNKENLKPEYLRLNPLGVVPTLVHDSTPVIESSVICEYLDDAYPQIPMKPTSAHAKAQMRLWMKHVDAKLHPSCGALQWPLVMRPKLMEKSSEVRQALLDSIPEKPRRDRQKRLMEMGLKAPDVEGAVQVYMQTIAKMESDLKRHTWLVSNSFSLADVVVAPYFQTLHQFGWQVMLKNAPLVTDWFKRCRQRDSYRIAVTADFSDKLSLDLQEIGRQSWVDICVHIKW